MSQISEDRLIWHECVVDMLSVSDVITDRDADGRAVYYLFGWSGTLQFIDEHGRLRECQTSVGSVRMDGFSIVTRTPLQPERPVVVTVRSPSGHERRVHALTRSSGRSTRQGKSIECVVTERPDRLDDRAVRLTVTQCFD